MVNYIFVDFVEERMCDKKALKSIEFCQKANYLESNFLPRFGTPHIR